MASWHPCFPRMLPMKSDKKTTTEKIIAEVATWQLIELLSFNKRDAIYNSAINPLIEYELKRRGNERCYRKNKNGN